jgi:hypothetical protein
MALRGARKYLINTCCTGVQQVVKSGQALFVAVRVWSRLRSRVEVRTLREDEELVGRGGGGEVPAIGYYFSLVHIAS